MKAKKNMNRLSCENLKNANSHSFRFYANEKFKNHMLAWITKKTIINIKIVILLCTARKLWTQPWVQHVCILWKLKTVSVVLTYQVWKMYTVHFAVVYSTLLQLKYTVTNSTLHCSLILRGVRVNYRKYRARYYCKES